jgi:hypothetical protein
VRVAVDRGEAQRCCVPVYLPIRTHHPLSSREIVWLLLLQCLLDHCPAFTGHNVQLQLAKVWNNKIVETQDSLHPKIVTILSYPVFFSSKYYLLFSLLKATFSLPNIFLSLSLFYVHRSHFFTSCAFIKKLYCIGTESIYIIYTDMFDMHSDENRTRSGVRRPDACTHVLCKCMGSERATSFIKPQKHHSFPMLLARIHPFARAAERKKRKFCSNPIAINWESWYIDVTCGAAVLSIAISCVASWPTFWWMDPSSFWLRYMQQLLMHACCPFPITIIMMYYV